MRLVHPFDLFVTAIADIKSFFQSAAEFLMEVFTGLIAGGTGGTFDAAQDDFSAGIGLPAVITVDTEVLGIIKGAFMIPVQLRSLGVSEDTMEQLHAHDWAVFNSDRR